MLNCADCTDASCDLKGGNLAACDMYDSGEDTINVVDTPSAPAENEDYEILEAAITDLDDRLTRIETIVFDIMRAVSQHS